MITKDELLDALKGLTSDQLAGILAQGHGRSPIRERQLSDLTLLPKADDPRPTFFQETDGREFPNRHLTSPYPALMWHVETGQEITVWSLAEQQAKGSLWTTTPPNSKPLDPVEHARLLFESLSAEDQAFVLETQRQARLARVTATMGTLTESQAAQAMVAPVKKGKKES